MVISKEDIILIESLYETKKLDKRWFRQFDYVLILFVMVTVNKFLK